MVVAVKENDIITIGVTSNENLTYMTDKDLSLKENLPFWKVNGTTGCYVVAENAKFSVDLLRYEDWVFKDVTDGNSIITNVVPKMKELLNAVELISKDGEWESRLLVIKDNKMFYIGNYFSVNEIDSLCVLGFDDVVLGGLEEFKDLPPKERILNSVRGLEILKNKRFFPITIFDTKSKKRKIYYK